MAPMATEDAHPRHVPAGFALRRRLDGSDATGFQDDRNQLQLIFTRGWDRSAWNFPFTVHLAESELPFFGTENTEGTALDLGVAGATAVYHDGIWSYDAARAQYVSSPREALYWSTEVHSVTARLGRRSYAVRAPKDVGTAELVKSVKNLLAR